MQKLQDDGEVSDYDDTEENEENIVSVFKKTFHEILKKKKMKGNKNQSEIEKLLNS